MIRDRDRQARQDKKSIEYLETEQKRVKGDMQDTREMLENKELENRNLKRDAEVGSCEFKSLEARFGKQLKLTESTLEQLNRKRVEHDKATALLTEANKAIKHKDLTVR